VASGNTTTEDPVTVDPTPDPEPEPTDPVDPATDTDPISATVPAGGSNQTTLRATSANQSISFNWDAHAGATLYQVRYRPEGGSRSWLPTTSELSARVDNLTPGSYEIAIRVYKSQKWQAWNIGYIEVR
jgi:hypothetical protein